MERKELSHIPKEVTNYYFFDNPQSRRDIFEIAQNVSQYLYENDINQLVLIDRSARPTYIAIQEYWKIIYPNKKIPKTFFINPNGFIESNRSQEKINQDFNRSYSELIKHKQEPVLLFDTCIHSGETINPVLETFKINGFKKVNVGVVYTDIASYAYNLVNFKALSKKPYYTCHPFKRELMIDKTYQNTSSIRSKNKDGINQSKKLRKEICQLTREQSLAYLRSLKIG
jgi:hypothetical protein